MEDLPYILQNYKTDSQKANQQITNAIKERYNQKVTSLGYIFPLDTLVTRPFNSLIRIQTIVVKVASYFIFALGGRRLMLETKATSITNSIGYKGCNLLMQCQRVWKKMKQKLRFQWYTTASN